MRAKLEVWAVSAAQRPRRSSIRSERVRGLASYAARRARYPSPRPRPRRTARRRPGRTACRRSARPRRAPPGGVSARAVRALGDHRVEGVGDGEHPRLGGNRRGRAGPPGSRRRPSARGGTERTGARRGSGVAGGRAARRPADGAAISSRSSGVSGPGFESTCGRTLTLPMSWSGDAVRSVRTRSRSQPSRSAIGSARAETRAT